MAVKNLLRWNVTFFLRDHPTQPLSPSPTLCFYQCGMTSAIGSGSRRIISVITALYDLHVCIIAQLSNLHSTATQSSFLKLSSCLQPKLLALIVSFCAKLFQTALIHKGQTSGSSPDGPIEPLTRKNPPVRARISVTSSRNCKCSSKNPFLHLYDHLLFTHVHFMAKINISIYSCGVCVKKNVMKTPSLLAKPRFLWPERLWWWPKSSRCSLSNTDVHTYVRTCTKPSSDMILEAWEAHRECDEAFEGEVYDTCLHGLQTVVLKKGDFFLWIQRIDKNDSTDEQWGSAASALLQRQENMPKVGTLTQNKL